MMKRLFGITGPDISKAQRIEFDISSTKVSFLAPAYSYDMWPEDEKKNQKRVFDLSDSNTYWSAQKEFKHRYDSGSPSSPDGFSLFHMLWSFRKGLFLSQRTGKEILYNQDTVELNVAVLKYDKFVPLFCRQKLEEAVKYDMVHYWGPNTEFGAFSDGHCMYTAPINWEARTLNGRDWVCYLLQRYGRYGSGMYKWFTPLSNDLILGFSFKNALEPSKLLAKETYEFMLALVSSCQIEPSEEVKKQMAKAKGADSSKISEYVEPFPWHSKEVLEEAVRNNPFPRSKALRD